MLYEASRSITSNMSKLEHFELLRKGIDTWNGWRRESSQIKPDLTGVDLSGENLIGFDFRQTNFSKANLSGAGFCETMLCRANLTNAVLAGAYLSGTNLTNTNLAYANLTGADLIAADLAGANLAGTNLTGATLTKAKLIEVTVDEADFNGALFWETVISNVYLDRAKHLDKCVHLGPSCIDHRTLSNSWKLSTGFLRGCGLSDWEIEVTKLYNPGLSPDKIIKIQEKMIKMRVGEPKNYYSCFISYSSLDETFVTKLLSDLQHAGVRAWRDAENMRIGDQIKVVINEAIRKQDKLLLILSANSARSRWVETEVEFAFEEERKRNKIVLFPIMLDNSVEDNSAQWAFDIRQTRLIGDFRHWETPGVYEQAFKRLLRDMRQVDAMSEDNR